MCQACYHSLSLSPSHTHNADKVGSGPLIAPLVYMFSLSWHVLFSLFLMSFSLCLCVFVSVSPLSLICVLQLNLFGSTPTLSSSLASIHPKQIPSEGRRGESMFSRCFSLSSSHTHTHTQARIIATQRVDRCGRTVKQFVIEVIWFKILSISLDRPVGCVYVGEEIKQWRWQREYRASNLNHHTHMHAHTGTLTEREHT